MRQNFTVAGPFGELSGVINLCEVETKRRNVLVIAHGFRGSMEGGGRAAQLADEIGESICSVVRFNFSWCTMLTNQIAELKAVLDFVRKTLQPEKLFLLGRSFGGATCIVTACEGDCCADAATENCCKGNKENTASEWYKRNTYRPDGMVLWSAPNSLQKTFIQVLRLTVCKKRLYRCWGRKHFRLLCRVKRLYWMMSAAMMKFRQRLLRTCCSMMWRPCYNDGKPVRC